MAIDNDGGNVRVESSGSTGGASGASGAASGGQGEGLISGETINVFLSLFEGKTVAGAPAPDGNISHETLKLILGNNFEQLEIDITFPALAMPDEVLVSIAIDMIGGLGLDDNHPLSILIKVVSEGAESGDNVEGDSSVDKSEGKGQPLSPQVKCAFLGGLVMVALSELLQDYAKEQSQMEKMMSEMWIETEAMLKELASTEAKNILEKAEKQALSNILQAVFAACACMVSVGAGKKSLSTLNKGGTGAVQKAGVYTQYGQAGSQAFTNVAGGAVKAWESLAVGDIDAQQKILENVEQQLQKMVDKYSSEGSDAGKRVADALDLLKNVVSALLQAFNKIGT